MEIKTYTAEQEAEMLRREESHFLDFKRADITPGKLQETVVALANADGGEVIIGLDHDIRRSPVDRFHGFLNPEQANNHVSVADTLIDPPVPAVSVQFIVCPTAASHLLLHLLIPKSPWFTTRLIRRASSAKVHKT